MRLNIDVLPAWRHRLMRDITRRDVRDLLDTVAERAPIVANRVRALLHKFFAVAIDHEVVDVNPVTGTPKPVKKESRRERVLTHDELRAFWTATESLPLEMRAAFRLLGTITAQRGGEVFGMRWQDVDLVGGWVDDPNTREQKQDVASRAAHGHRARHPQRAAREDRRAAECPERAQTGRFRVPICTRQKATSRSCVGIWHPGFSWT